jgi:poly(3-hydroxyalkanoate) synthetase
VTLTGPPPLTNLVLEVPRALIDLQRLVVLAPLLRVAPAGDGHPVLVLPGFLAGDATTAPVRAILRSLGYPTYRWRLGRNIGPTDDAMTALGWSLKRLTEMHGRTVSMIGWSLGGIMAREVANLAPQHVRQVISLGSSVGMEDPSQSRVSDRYDRFRELHSDQFRLGEGYMPSPDPLAVPSTAIYTRTDGIVPWHTCTQRSDERSENIEVTGAHIGLGHHPAAVLAITDRLAQPEKHWRPFRPPVLVRRWYPTPVKG